MFYFLSKTLDLLAAPITWSLMLVVASAGFAHRRRHRHAVRLAAAAAGVLYLFSTPIFANALVRRLEADATATVSARSTYDVVVLLGGMATRGDVGVEYTEAVDRLITTYDVIHENRARYVLVTSDTEEAPLLAKQLTDWDVAPERIVVEQQSRNTHDNAVLATKIIEGRGWTRVLLVTSALHMPRAQGCFRVAGLEVDTLPVDHRAESHLRGGWFEPRASALMLSTDGLRELVGRWAYWAVGYAR